MGPRRAAIEEVWGGDDFDLTFSVDEIRSALSPDGLIVRTQLTEAELPAVYPTSLTDRRAIRQLERVELGPAPRPDRDPQTGRFQSSPVIPC